MKNLVELLQLSQSPKEVMQIVESAKIKGYIYAVSNVNYPKFQAEFGDDTESDMMFSEDPKAWLVELFDCKDFTDFEQQLINYFGGEQKAIAFLSANKQYNQDDFAETSRQKVIVEEPQITIEEDDGILDVLGDMFSNSPESANENDIFDELANEDDIFAKEEEKEEERAGDASVADVLQYLSTIDKKEVRGLFLNLFSKNIADSSVMVTGVLYDSLLKGLMKANEAAPTEAEALVEKIMSVLIHGMEG